MNNNLKNLWPLLIIIAAASARLFPHMPNLAPITAIAIFSAVTLSGRQAIVITFGARLLSDLILGFFSWPLMLAVYAAHGIGLLLGWALKRANLSSARLLGYGTLAGGSAAIVFFLITNFAFFYSIYPHTWAGIVSAYTNGLPFLRGTLLGDVGYCVALFGSYALVKALVARRVRLGSQIKAQLS